MLNLKRMNQHIAPLGGKIEYNEETDEYTVSFPNGRTGPITVAREAFAESEGYIVSAIQKRDGRLFFTARLGNDGGKPSETIPAGDKVKITIEIGGLTQELNADTLLFAATGIDSGEDAACGLMGGGDDKAMLSLIGGIVVAAERALGFEKMADMFAFIISRREEGTLTSEITEEIVKRFGVEDDKGGDKG